MKYERHADRRLDAIVVAVVLLVVGFAATAPRASPESIGPSVAIVPMPATGCEQATPAHQRSCLLAAQASTLRQ